MKMTTSSLLPVRIAQNRHARLDAFDEAWFRFLKTAGVSAIYLQNAPFDPMRTGNVGQFFHHFHLISLFDLARSHRRSEYQDYVNTICGRAHGHGLEVWLDCWEPRLPAHAQAMIPPAWRGRGGWGWHGDKRIAFCWEHPDAVAYWKAMAVDALGATPALDGVIVSMIDNEASFCDATCPRCEGRSLEAGILDVFRTFTAIASSRPHPLKIAMYDWWMPATVTGKIMEELPDGSLIIGRSARGMKFEAPDGFWSGRVADISNTVDGVGDDFVEHCRKGRAANLQPIDMVAWSRGMENFLLPAPPDPLFAIRKCKALAGSGAAGWIDYDCGNLEPGALAEAVHAWSDDPDASEDVLLKAALRATWGDAMETVLPAYEDYRAAKSWFPTGLESKEVGGMDSRCCGLGFILFGPWQLDDLAFYDSTHACNFFAPYNLLVEDSIPAVLKSASQVDTILGRAWERICLLSPEGEAACRDHAAFEIHWRNFKSIHGYVRMAEAKWRFVHGGLPAEQYRSLLRTLALAELENLDAVERWVAKHPDTLGNPCHRILGHLGECWPDADFSAGIFEPKRRSLEFLRDRFDPCEWVPGYEVLGTASDDGSF